LRAAQLVGSERVHVWDVLSFAVAISIELARTENGHGRFDEF
jgi:hypothetical protein